jgi:hypothetical protein
VNRMGRAAGPTQAAHAWAWAGRRMRPRRPCRRRIRVAKEPR